MEILAEIHCHENLDVRAPAVERTAVRGVVLRGRQLLMIYSAAAGDYKFPGGGVHPGESHRQALSREIQEECGAALTEFGPAIGAILEYDLAQEHGYGLFKMTSHYYHCKVVEEFGPQRLEGYESDLGFQPVWIETERALRLNQALLHSADKPHWLDREIFALRYLLRHPPSEASHT